MSRERTIQISALNIAMHTPHSPQRYIDFIHDAFWIKDRVKLSNVHFAMIGSIYRDDPDDDRSAITGEIFRFVKIDQNEPWFNDLTKEPATDMEKNEVTIPEYLLPNLQRIPFVFLPTKHCLYVVTKDRKDAMSASTVKKILEHVFERVIIEKGYPEVTITVIPTEESVEKVLSIASLERLSIELVRPNADDDNELEEQFMRRLENQNASKFTQEMTSSRNDTLAPDDDTKRLARLASRNGRVIGYGYDVNGVKVKESTDQIPKIKHVTVNTNLETTRDVLKRVANSWENN